MNVVWYLVVMAGVTYLIRALPFILCREKVKSPFLRVFFAYIPYSVLAAMTIPHMIYAGKNPVCGVAALVVAIILALCKRSLVTVAAGASVAAYLTGLLI